MKYFQGIELLMFWVI